MRTLRAIGTWLIVLGVLELAGMVVCFVTDAAAGPLLLVLGGLSVVVGGGIRLALMGGTTGGTGGDGSFGGGGL